MNLDLPRCPNTDLERLGCGCPGCESFTMTESEKALRSGVINILDLERRAGRPVSEYRMRVRPLGATTASRTWQQIDQIDCDHDQRSTRLCASCEVLFENLIGDIPALVENLEEAVARDVRFVDHGTTTAPDESPLGLYQAASDALASLRDSLIHSTTVAQDPALPEPAGRAAIRASRWMLAHWQDALRHVDVRGVAHRVSKAAGYALRVIDRPRDLMFLGDCPEDCGAQLWPERGAKLVTCPNEACDWSGSVDDLVQQWLKSGEDRYLGEQEIRRALPDVTRSQLRWWIDHEGVPRQEMTRARMEHGQMVTRTYEAYRLGSVRELYAADLLARQTLATERTGTLTSRELADRAGVDVSTIRKYVERGVIAPVRRGARPLRFTADQVNILQARKAS